MLRRRRALRARVVRRPRRPARRRAVPGPPARRPGRGAGARPPLRRRDRAGSPAARSCRRRTPALGSIVAGSSCGRRCGRSRAPPRMLWRCAPPTTSTAMPTAVVAYGEHVRRFVAGIRGRDDDVFIAPQSVEAELFGRPVSASEIAAFRGRSRVGRRPTRPVRRTARAEKGVAVLLDAWRQLARAGATLVADRRRPAGAGARADAGRCTAARTARARAAAGRVRRGRRSRCCRRSRRRASASPGAWSATRRCTRAGR